MSQQGPLPAIDPNQLGDTSSFEIDKLLIPYLLGVIQELTNPATYYGDPEDIQGTIYAFETLLSALSDDP